MPTSSNERSRILRMIEEGKLSADEAGRLLDALEGEAQRTDQKHRNRRIRVVVSGSTSPPFNVTFPLQLARTALSLVPKGLLSADREVDLERLLQLIEEGVEGKICDIQHPEAQVQIFVE